MEVRGQFTDLIVWTAPDQLRNLIADFLARVCIYDSCSQSCAFRCGQALEEVRDRELGEVAEFAGIEKRSVAGVAGLVPDVSLF